MGKVIISACEQCGRSRLPEFIEPLTFDDGLASINGRNTKILLHPGSAGSLSKLLAPENQVIILVGPEGGLSDAELNKIYTDGYQGINYKSHSNLCAIIP